VHLEGPFLSAEQRGAHRADLVRHPSPEEVRRILEYEDIVTEVTLAPELPGALALTRDFAHRGILVSAGHSVARERDIVRAIESGIRHTTHIFSSMSSVVKEGPYRIPGLLESTLASDKLTTEMIADGKHLPPTLMRLVLKSKGLNNVCLVSDAMRGAGKAEGEVLMVAGQEAVIEDGVAVALDRTHFAGSITPLDRMVRNVIELLGLSVEEAVRMVTLNPARILGIQESKGSIEPGRDADLVMFDSNVKIQHTWVLGKTVFSAH
jgi:N-acetylglucosamine-6-phosphate deacetylase